MGYVNGKADFSGAALKGMLAGFNGFGYTNDGPLNMANVFGNAGPAAAAPSIAPNAPSFS